MCYLRYICNPFTIGSALQKANFRHCANLHLSWLRPTGICIKHVREWWLRIESSERRWVECRISFPCATPGVEATGYSRKYSMGNTCRYQYGPLFSMMATSTLESFVVISFLWTTRQLRNVQCTLFPNYRLYIYNRFIQCCLKKLSVQDEPTSRDLGILSSLQSIVWIAVGVQQDFGGHFDFCNSHLQ